jgi:hypothetical protein
MAEFLAFAIACSIGSLWDALSHKRHRGRGTATLVSYPVTWLVFFVLDTLSTLQRGALNPLGRSFIGNILTVCICATSIAIVRHSVAAAQCGALLERDGRSSCACRLSATVVEA